MILILEPNARPESTEYKILTGHLDEFFDETVDASQVPSEDFYLLIDSPLVETNWIAMPGAELNHFTRARF